MTKVNPTPWAHAVWFFSLMLDTEINLSKIQAGYACKTKAHAVCHCVKISKARLQ